MKYEVKIQFANCVKVYIETNIDAAIKRGKYWRDVRNFPTKIIKA